jgi:antitoxin VapB
MTVERHVKLFKNGRNQAVRIPREFELPGHDAIMRKKGERLVIEPCPSKSLLALLTTLAPLDEDFPIRVLNLSSFSAVSRTGAEACRPIPVDPSMTPKPEPMP